MTAPAPADRYHRAGLSGNPFALPPTGDDDPEAWFVERGLPPAPAPGRSRLIQVIGQRGAGKTTQLARWRRDSPGPTHWVPARPYRQRWRLPPVGPIVYGDEIDRLPRPVRRRWFRRVAAAGATVVIGTHRDLAGEARRAGLAVATHTLGPVDRATLGAIVERRVESHRLADGAPAIIEADDIDLIHARCEGSIRTAEQLGHALIADRVAQR